MSPLIGASRRRKDSSAGSPFSSVALRAQIIPSGGSSDFPRLSMDKRNGRGVPSDSEPPATSTPSSASATPTPSDQIEGVIGGIFGSGASNVIPTKPSLPTSSISGDFGNSSPRSSAAAQSIDNFSESSVLSGTGLQQPISTTEIFPTAVPTELGSNGETSIASELTTSSRVVQTTHTLGNDSRESGSVQRALSSPKKIEVIVGGVVGGIIFLSLLVALSIFLLRRRRRFRQEMNVTSHMVIPEPDLFRPAPGTGWDIENASHHSGSTSAESESSTKPIGNLGLRLTVRRKPVPGLIPTPTVSDSPFCDPRQSREFDRIPITPEPIHVARASAAARDPFADPVTASAPLHRRSLS